MSGGLLAGIVVLLASPEAATRAPAPARDAKVDAAVQKLAPAMVEARHRIHQNPELGNRETKTAELIADPPARAGARAAHRPRPHRRRGEPEGGAPRPLHRRPRGHGRAARHGGHALPVQVHGARDVPRTGRGRLARLRARHPRGGADGGGRHPGRDEGRAPGRDPVHLPARGRGTAAGREGRGGAHARGRALEGAQAPGRLRAPRFRPGRRGDDHVLLRPGHGRGRRARRHDQGPAGPRRAPGAGHRSGGRRFPGGDGPPDHPLAQRAAPRAHRARRSA